MTKHLNIHKPLPFSLSRIWFTLLFLVVFIGGGWSQNITKVEYFFDTDPGYDAGTSVPLTPSPDLNNLNFNVDLTGINDGIHRLFVRAKDENGVWSFSNIHTFYKDAIQAPLYDLTKVEYFIDTDPGLGNGTDVPFTPSPDISNLNFSIDITGISDGMHQLYIRTKNQNGQWSLTTRKLFYKQDYTSSNTLITYAEYYFDTDPGYGQATSIPVSPNASDVSLDFNIDLTSLLDGFHQLCVRVKDSMAQVGVVTNLNCYFEKPINGIPMPGRQSSMIRFISPRWCCHQRAAVIGQTGMGIDQSCLKLLLVTYGYWITAKKQKLRLSPYTIYDISPIKYWLTRYYLCRS